MSTQTLNMWSAFSPKTIVRDLMDLKLEDIGFLVVLMAIMSCAMIYWESAWLEWLSSLTGVMCVFLVARRKLSNYFWGIINVTTYTYIAYNAKYFGDTMLFGLFYTPIQFIGAYLWSKHMFGENVISRKIESFRALFMLGIGATFITFGYAMLLESIGGNLPAVDAFTTVGSVLATFFMVYGYREQWLVWIAINLSSIYMWANVYMEDGTGVGMLAMWSVYLINSTYGTYIWFKGSKSN
ncbi:nicotinamide riboside transporter [Vibrio phage BONAISHI]|nr:nicotinamide riboside transporter [Vibrio phage BONAISHI]